MKVTLKDSSCIIEREPNDGRMRRGGFGASAESQLLHRVKRVLQTQGLDVIKKLMWKDGHMVDSHQHYVRTRDWSIAIYSGENAIRDMGEVFNREGRVELLVVRDLK